MQRIAPYIYAILIVGLFFHPHFSAHVGPELKPFVEGLTNLVIVGLGILTYYIYKREQREFGERFLETSTYIGAMNRRLPILQNITTDLISGGTVTAKQKAKLFQELIGIACATLAKSDAGLLRFVETATGRTVKEFWYTLGNKKADSIVLVGNKVLLRYGSSPKRAAMTENGYLIVSASDIAAPVRAFLVIPCSRKEISELIPMLRAVVDQGQLLSRYVFGDFSKSYA